MSTGIKKWIVKDESSRTKKAISLTFTSGINSVLGVIWVMLLTRLLSKEDYAIYSRTQLVLTTFISMLALGIPTLLYKQLEENRNRRRAIFLENILTLFVLAFLFSLFLILGGNQLLATLFNEERIAFIILLSIPYILFAVPAQSIKPAFVSLNYMTFNVKISILMNFILSIGSIISILVFHTYYSAIFARQVMMILFWIVGFYLLLHYILPKDGSKIQRSSFNILFKLGVPLGLSSILSGLFRSIDKWIISTLRSPEEYAIYAIGAHELPIVSLITASISTVIIVDITSLVVKKDMNSAVKLFKMAAERTMIFMAPVFLFSVIFAQDLVTVLYSDQYVLATPVFVIYQFLLPIEAIHYGPFLIALGKTREMMIKTMIGLVFNTISSIIFVKFFGNTGAAIATIITMYVVSVPMNYIMISKGTGINIFHILPIKQFVVPMLLCIPSCVIVLIGKSLLVTSEPLKRIIILSLIFCAIYGVIVINVYKKVIKELLLSIRKR